jgi:hypothetical protein
MNFLLYSTHSDMALVNPNVIIFPTRLFILEFVFCQLYINSIEGIVLVLMREIYPGRDTIDHLPVLQLYYTFYFAELLYLSL